MNTLLNDIDHACLFKTCCFDYSNKSRSPSPEGISKRQRFHDVTIMDPTFVDGKEAASLV